MWKKIIICFQVFENLDHHVDRNNQFETKRVVKLPHQLKHIMLEL